MRVEPEVRLEDLDIARQDLEGHDPALGAGRVRELQRRVAPARATVDHAVARADPGLLEDRMAVLVKKEFLHHTQRMRVEPKVDPERPQVVAVRHPAVEVQRLALALDAQLSLGDALQLLVGLAPDPDLCVLLSGDAKREQACQKADTSVVGQRIGEPLQVVPAPPNPRDGLAALVAR